MWPVEAAPPLPRTCRGRRETLWARAEYDLRRGGSRSTKWIAGCETRATLPIPAPPPISPRPRFLSCCSEVSGRHVRSVRFQPDLRHVRSVRLQPDLTEETCSHAVSSAYRSPRII